MMKKRILFLAILILIGLAYLVIAATGDGVKILSPASGNGYSSRSGILYNVSYTNITDITNPQNATFFLNISGIWTAVANVNCNSNNSCAAIVVNTTIPDGAYSVNATIRNLTTTATISVTNSSNLSTLVYFDGTAPQVFTENITFPVSERNYSGNLILNVSVIDVTIGVNTVRFNITNHSSGLQNSTVILSQEGSTSKYSLTINTSHYPDGVYNLTVYANDTVNNLNNSALVYKIIFDNTLPSLTHSCDDYSVEEDDVITCTCTASDSLSRINTSYDGDGVLFTAKPSTSSTGNNQQTTCTSQDTAGNFNTSTLYYNVTGGSSSSGGSSGGSSSGSSTGSTGSSNSSSNSTLSNSTSGNANNLQGNQQNGDIKNKIKINYWILGAVILGAALIVLVAIRVRKKIKNRR